jgi:adenine/guanine phosphoribosyltransferase-like PRPP-binding protein
MPQFTNQQIMYIVGAMAAGFVVGAYMSKK